MRGSASIRFESLAVTDQQFFDIRMYLIKISLLGWTSPNH